MKVWIASCLVWVLVINPALGDIVPLQHTFRDFYGRRSVNREVFDKQALSQAAIFPLIPMSRARKVYVASGIGVLRVLDARIQKMVPLRYVRGDQLTRRELRRALKSLSRWKDAHYEKEMHLYILSVLKMALNESQRTTLTAGQLSRIGLAFSLEGVEGYIRYWAAASELQLIEVRKENQSAYGQRFPQKRRYEGVGSALRAAALQDVLNQHPGHPVTIRHVESPEEWRSLKWWAGGAARVGETITLSARQARAVIAKQRNYVKKLVQKYGLLVAPMVFDGVLGQQNVIGWAETEDVAYPIRKMPDRREVLEKYKGFYHQLDGPLRSRAVYEVARALNAKVREFDGANIVQLQVVDGNKLISVEERFGRSLQTDLFDLEARIRLAHTLNVISQPLAPEEASRNYRDAVRRYGRSFIEGDIFRLFAFNVHESHYLDQVRLSDAASPRLIRWVDYDDAFLTTNAREHQKLKRYLEIRKDHFLSDGRLLVEAIAGMSNDSIEEISERVFGAGLRQWILSEAKPHDTERLSHSFIEQMERQLASLKAAFVKEVKTRRDVFKAFAKTEEKASA